MIQDSETELAFFILTFTEEGLGLLLGLRMLTLQLIAAQKNCVVLVPSVNTVSFGLDWFVTLRPLRKKNQLHESGMAKGLQTSGRLQVYFGLSKLYCQHIYFHIYFQNIITWDEAINKINQSLMLWIVTRRHTPVGHRKQRQMLPKCSKLQISPVSPSLCQAEKKMGSQARQCSPEDCYQGTRSTVENDHGTHVLYSRTSDMALNFFFPSSYRERLALSILKAIKTLRGIETCVKRVKGKRGSATGVWGRGKAGRKSVQSCSNYLWELWSW